MDAIPSVAMTPNPPSGTTWKAAVARPPLQTAKADPDVEKPQLQTPVKREERPAQKRDPWINPWPAGGPYARENEPLAFGPSKDVNILTRAYDRAGNAIPEPESGVELLKPHGLMDLFG